MRRALRGARSNVGGNSKLAVDVWILTLRELATTLAAASWNEDVIP
jgi:hypothetical protein